MATRFEQIIDALVPILEADAAITVGSVHRQRASAFNDVDLPAYNIVYGPDEPLGELGPDNMAFIDWAMVVFIDCYERSSAVDVDNLFQDMRRNIHRAIMADVTLGLAFVITTIPQGAEEPLVDDSGEKKNMIYRTNWIFRLRTSIADLET